MHLNLLCISENPSSTQLEFSEMENVFFQNLFILSFNMQAKARRGKWNQGAYEKQQKKLQAISKASKGGAGPLVEVQDNNVLSEMKYAQGRTRLVSKTKHE